MHLFLDRDGVINKRIVGDYVRNLSQWQWLPNSLEAIVILSQHFENIFVVTNQQGIGKGYFSAENVQDIFLFIEKNIAEKGGKIAAFYCCPHLKSENCDCRKPQIGMALQAKKEFPTLNFEHAVMVGDSLSDMQFGRNAGMKTIFITTDYQPKEEDMPLIDEIYPSLWDYAQTFFRKSI